MNKMTTQAKVGEYVQMPHSLRRLCAKSDEAVWEFAQNLANENAEATWRPKFAALEKQRKELTADCAAYAAETATLRAKVIEVEAKATASAQGEARSNRRIKEISVEAKRLLDSVELVVSYAANLKFALEALQTLPATGFAEIDAQGVPTTPSNCIDEPVLTVEPTLKDESSHNCTLSTIPIPAEPPECRQLTDAEVVATAKIILAAADKLRSVGAFSAGHAQPSHSACGCSAEQTVPLNSPAQPPESNLKIIMMDVADCQG